MTSKINHIAELRRSVAEFEELTEQVKRQLQAFEDDKTPAAGDIPCGVPPLVVVDGNAYAFTMKEFEEIVKQRDRLLATVADIKTFLLDDM